jgi:hypothetical protein
MLGEKQIVGLSFLCTLVWCNMLFKSVFFIKILGGKEK